MNAAKKVLDAVRKFDEGLRILSSGPADYYLNVLEDQQKMLFERFAPVKIGDRVKLMKTPDFEKCYSWKICKHWLKRGAIGTVREVGTYGDKFTADIIFDDESWIDEKGKIHPNKPKHTYHFFEGDFKKINPRGKPFISPDMDL